MKNFKETPVKGLNENIFRLFDDAWTLITAGNSASFNTMTASWGCMGILWNKPVAICFIRPHRYTYRFTEEFSSYTLSFFEEKHRDILKFCGSCSGRTTDKIEETGLTPIVTRGGNMTFEQARLVFECRKIYAGNIMEENFVMKELIPKNYPGKDFHRFYIGEIEKCFIK